MSKVKNIIVEQMPYCVTKGAFIEARFKSVHDALLFSELMNKTYPDLDWSVIFQFYNDHGALLMVTWGDMNNIGSSSET